MNFFSGKTCLERVQFISCLFSLLFRIATEYDLVLNYTRGKTPRSVFYRNTFFYLSSRFYFNLHVFDNKALCVWIDFECSV